MADLNVNKEELRKLRAQAQDIVTDFAQGLSNVFSQLFGEAGRDASEFTNNLNKGLSETEKIQQKIEKNQKEIARWQGSSSKIESQIVDLYHKHQERISKINDYTQISEKTKRQAIQNANTDYQKQNQILNDQVEQIEKQENVLGGIGKLMNSISKTPFLGDLMNTEGAMKKIRMELAMSGNMTKALSGGFKVLGKSMAAAFPLALFSAVLSASIQLDNQITETARNLGKSRVEVLKMRDHFAETANISDDLRVNVSQMLVVQDKLNQLRGTASVFDREQLSRVQATLDAGVMTEEAALNLLRISNITGTTFKENQLIQIGAAKEIANERKMRLDIQGLLDTANKITGQVRANIGANPAQLMKTIALAKSFGMELDQIASASKSLLNFESSIGAELEAELLLGRQINLERARLYALTGDYDGLMREINANVGDFHEFSKLNVLQQDALAKSMGMSSDQLSDMLFKEADLESLKEQALLEGNEALLQNYERLSTQEEFNKAVLRLKEIFVDIVAPALEQFVGFMDKIEGKGQGIKNLFKVGIAGSLLYVLNMMSKWPSIIALSSAAMRVLAGTSFGAALGIGAQTALSPNPANVLSAGTLGLGVLATIAAALATYATMKYVTAGDIMANNVHGNTQVTTAGVGTFSLNNQDQYAYDGKSFMAGTNLFGGNKGGGGNSADINKLTAATNRTNDLLANQQQTVVVTSNPLDDMNPMANYGSINKQNNYGSQFQSSRRGA